MSFWNIGKILKVPTNCRPHSFWPKLEEVHIDSKPKVAVATLDYCNADYSLSHRFPSGAADSVRVRTFICGSAWVSRDDNIRAYLQDIVRN